MISLVERAARIAVDAHKEQKRKSDGSPYIVHPFMCAMLLQQHGFEEEVIAAALVHDVVEDTGWTFEQLEEDLGAGVGAIVRAVSEDQSYDWRSEAGGWEKVKQMYADTIREVPAGAKAVSIADKIHNMHSLFDAYEKQGPALWSRFTKGKDKKLWFEELVLTALQDTWQHPLVDEYAALVAKMRALD